MSSIRSKGNKSTEQALRYRLVRAGIRGWRILDSTLPGKPDFTFRDCRLIVFVDGCYWHGCPKCYRAPSSNQSYWQEKLERNKKRDRLVVRALRRDGWHVVRVWEHEITLTPQNVIAKIRSFISRPN